MRETQFTRTISRRLLSVTVQICVPVVLLAARGGEAAVPPDVVHAHWLEPRGFIHANLSHHGFGPEVSLQVSVTPNGRVESAQAIDGPREFYGQAEMIEMGRRFKPFLKAGEPARVSFADFVEIVPEERWGPKVPFPEVKDWSSLRFSLERPTWYCGGCPAYSVEIRGDGAVIFHGEHGVAMTGTQQAEISKQQVAALLERFRQADYFSLNDKYEMGATDLPTVITSITIDGQTKTVTDYAGIEVGMPEVVERLEKAVDTTAGTDKWIRGKTKPPRP